MCDNDKTCCGENCCESALCKQCVNGECVYSCNTDNCETCVGGVCKVCGGDWKKCCGEGDLCCDTGPGKCCYNGQCLDDPECDNCHTINETSYECGHYEYSTYCASDWCIKNVLVTATCDYHPGAKCTSKCTAELAIPLEPAEWQYKYNMSLPNCLTGGEYVLYHKWLEIIYGCPTCDAYEVENACDAFDCEGELDDYVPADCYKHVCTGTCP